ncbi:MAG: hypothetical protein ACI35R_00245 [Bacillus sp. (in: firmicutes)]
MMNDGIIEYIAVELTHGWELLQNAAAGNLLAFFRPDCDEIYVVHDFFEDGMIIFRARIESADTVTILLQDDSVIGMVDYEEKQIRVDEVEVLAELEMDFE